MKILVINNAATSKRGDDFCVYKNTGEFGAELKKLDYNVEYFQFYNEAHSNIHSYSLNANGIKVSIARMWKIKLFSYFVAYLKAMKRVLSQDFIYIYYPNTFFILAFFCKLIGKKYGLYLRGEVGVDSKMSRLLYKYATVVFTVSDTFTERLNHEFSQNKAYTIRPMISYTAKDIVSTRTYQNPTEFRILYLGRIDKDKGLFELINAVNTLRKNGVNNFCLDVVGDGHYLEELKSLVLELGISDAVIFHGAVYGENNIRDKFLQADLYILPTYHEGFPRTLYEAMIFGTPIITTFVGGMSGLMKDRYNCREITVRSTSSIVTVVTSVLKDYEAAAQLANNGTKTVMELFNKRKLSHAEHLNEIIQKTVNV